MKPTIAVKGLAPNLLSGILSLYGQGRGIFGTFLYQKSEKYPLGLFQYKTSKLKDS